MIYPEIADLAEWLKKTGVEIAEYTCTKCGNTFETTVPIISRDFVGVQTPVHECGPGYLKSVVTLRINKAKWFWDTIV